MIKQLNINKMKNLNYKAMRKFAFTLLMLLTLSSNAQTYNTVKFLGIPVDGSKAEMISQLKKKGFKPCTDPKLAEYEALEGEFNGRQVHIGVVTNNNKVYRIVVQDAKTINETDIKIRYNTLVDQFMNNKKYFYNSKAVQFLDEDFDISYEMSVNNKRIQSTFTQRLSDSEIQSLLISMPEINGYDKEFQEILFEQAAYESNSVWFMISKLDNYDNMYWIALFYDNLNNAPNGDDL